MKALLNTARLFLGFPVEAITESTTDAAFPLRKCAPFGILAYTDEEDTQVVETAAESPRRIR